MNRSSRWIAALVVAAFFAVPGPASAQLVTLPPDGDNQKASV